ncbi:MAG: hypothetical protein Q8L90_02120 [Bacteroidota bacterium]|nr:hypothetical protein [Bacteroidota bacterium]
MEYNPTDIFTQSDLQKLTTSNSINGNIVIRGEHLKKLEKVETIDGFLGISDSDIESLGDLTEITGDFWTSFHTVFSPLKSLGQLEKIGGDASFRYSNLSDLGNLKYVGGKLSLRDTPISDLGQLQFVGGDLYLPKRLKDNIDLNDIHVVGKIQFWNDSKSKKQIADKTSLNLRKSEIPVPYWTHQYVYSSDELTSASVEQKKFYDHFKKLFLENVFIDIEGNDNYSFILYYDLIREYYQHKDIKILQQQFDNLEKYYPKTGNYTSLSIIDEFEKQSDYNSAWKFLKRREYISVQTVWKYEQKLKRKLLDGDLMVRLGGFSHLTDFGQNNIESIKPFAEKYLQTYEKEENSNFFDLFFDSDRLYRASSNNNYSAEYYHKFYLSESEYLHYKSIDDKQNALNDSTITKHVVEKAILNQFRLILKKAEDLYRAVIGMPKIGEGWISETELFYKIKDTLTEYEVIHHGNPDWLGRQHLDIYFPILKIGIEYQGLQHYEPVEYFGGKEAFQKNMERDEKKRKLCEINNCVLIYVNEKYDFDKVVLEIKKRIQIING